jgi:hypothetical protein
MSITRTFFSCDLQQVHTVTYPAGAAAGDAVILVARGSATAGPPLEGEFSDAFSQLATQSTSGSGLSIFRRILTGTEGASFTITDSGTVRWALSLFHVTDFAGTTGDIVASAALGLDPPSRAAPSGSNDVIWIAGATWQSSAVQVSTYPSGYTDTEQLVCSVSLSTKPWTAYGLLANTASSENPGAFTLDGTGDNPASFTIGVAVTGAVNPNKITITGIKEPNEADTLVDGVTTARVKLWFGSADTGAEDQASENQSITNGTLTVTGIESGAVDDPVIVEVMWMEGTERKLFITETTLQEDV